VEPKINNSILTTQKWRLPLPSRHGGKLATQFKTRTLPPINLWEVREGVAPIDPGCQFRAGSQFSREVEKTPGPFPSTKSEVPGNPARRFSPLYGQDLVSEARSMEV
jgi:hypothetical protein